MIQQVNLSNNIKNKLRQFDNAKTKIDRKLVLDIAKTLNIYFKPNALIELDKEMLNKAGKNSSLKIIKINKFIDTYSDLNFLRRKILEFSKNKLNKKVCIIKDANILVQFNSEGIKKTFSGRTVENKLQSAYKLEQIVEESIYFCSSYNPNDASGIKYHHFLAVAKVYNEESNVFVRIVIKEYTKDRNVLNKFYYHQFEYINIK